MDNQEHTAPDPSATRRHAMTSAGFWGLVVGGAFYGMASFGDKRTRDFNKWVAGAVGLILGAITAAYTTLKVERADREDRLLARAQAAVDATGLVPVMKPSVAPGAAVNEAQSEGVVSAEQAVQREL